MTSPPPGPEGAGEQPRWQPPARGWRSWFTAGRVERLVRVGWVLLVAAALGLVIVGWSVVGDLLEAPTRRLAETCARGPASHGVITAAGGPTAITATDPALAPYTRARGSTERWLWSLHDAAARAAERDLARHALAAVRSATPSLADLAAIEVACAEVLERIGVPPAPAPHFRAGA
jgi:hypothetical protein